MLPGVNGVSKKQSTEAKERTNVESMPVTHTRPCSLSFILQTSALVFSAAAPHTLAGILFSMFSRDEAEDVETKKKKKKKSRVIKSQNWFFQLEIKIGSKHPFKHLLSFFSRSDSLEIGWKWNRGNCWAVLEVDQATGSTYWLEGPEEPWSSGQSGCLWSKRTWVWFQLRPNVFSLLGYKEVGIKWHNTSRHNKLCDLAYPCIYLLSVVS